MLTAMSVDYPLCPPVEGIPRAQVNVMFESTKTRISGMQGLTNMTLYELCMYVVVWVCVCV